MEKVPDTIFLLYGSIRLNTSYNGVNEKHKYIGQYYDGEFPDSRIV